MMLVVCVCVCVCVTMSYMQGVGGRKSARIAILDSESTLPVLLGQLAVHRAAR